MLKNEPYCIEKRSLTNPSPEPKQSPTQRPPFKFSMVGLNIGDEIVFDPTNIIVKVATDNKIEHQGRLYSLSAFTGTFLPESMQNNSGTYYGQRYFSYNGKTLYDLRNEMESGAE